MIAINGPAYWWCHTTTDNSSACRSDSTYYIVVALEYSDGTFRSLRWCSSVIHVHQNKLVHLSIICSHSPHTLSHFHICSLVRQCGIHVLETLRMCEMFRLANNWRVKMCELSAIKAVMVFTWISVPTVFSHPACGMSSTNFLPSPNALCHQQMVALLRYRSPYTPCISIIVSAADNPRYT